MNMIFPYQTRTAAPEDTWDVARALAEQLSAGSVIALHGELGAGKTCFIQGLGYALGVRRPMTSPTFTIANEYRVEKGLLIHMDLYRLGSPDELLAMGFEQHMIEGALIAIEWPDRAGDLLPADTIHVRLSLCDDSEERDISIKQNA